MSGLSQLLKNFTKNPLTQKVFPFAIVGLVAVGGVTGYVINNNNKSNQESKTAELIAAISPTPTIEQTATPTATIIPTLIPTNIPTPIPTNTTAPTATKPPTQTPKSYKKHNGSYFSFNYLTGMNITTSTSQGSEYRPNNQTTIAYNGGVLTLNSKFGRYGNEGPPPSIPCTTPTVRLSTGELAFREKGFTPKSYLYGIKSTDAEQKCYRSSWVISGVTADVTNGNNSNLAEFGKIISSLKKSD